MPTTLTTVQIDMWGPIEGAAAGTSFMIGGDFESFGRATYCPTGTGEPPCAVLTGVLVVDSFVPSDTATFSYNLRDADGTTYAADHVSVDTWCEGHPLCE